MNKLALTLSAVCYLFLANQVHGQWTKSGIAGENIRALAIGGNNIFAGTQDSGVFLSTNNGASWTAVNNGLPRSEFVTAFAISGDNVFTGTNNYSTGGVYLSMNNGESWSEVDSGITDRYINVFAVSGNNIFAGTSAGGVFLSTNNGASWTTVNNGLTIRYCPSPQSCIEGFYEDFNARILGLVVSGNNIFAGGSNYYGLASIYLSTNNGASWAVVDTGLPNNISLTTLALSSNTIFAGCDHGGIYLSTNNGMSWTGVNNAFINSTKVTSFAVSGNNIFAGTDSGIYLSTNNGASWAVVNAGLVNTSISALAGNGNDIFAGTGNGVWRRSLSEMLGIINPKKSILFSKFTGQNLIAFTPSNQTIEISFSLVQSQIVTLKIYNLSGREIATLVNKNLGTGAHSLSWDTKNVAAGCYAVKMQVGSNVFVKNIPVSK